MEKNWLQNIKTAALALAIIVVFNLFIGMGLQTFYPSPQFDEFCPMEEPTPQTQLQCEEMGGRWITPGEVIEPRIPSLADPQPYCDATFTCRQEFEDANSVYRRNAFIVWVIAGFVALVAGQMINASTAVSTGFTFAGVLSFVVGAIGYWSDMDEVLRFILLGIVLAVLIWLGYRKTHKE
jgi:hypothetical protein